MNKTVLVTGSEGFMGRHVCLALEKEGYAVLPFDINDSEISLIERLLRADAVIHLAGVNRPCDNQEFYSGNAELTLKIVSTLLSLQKRVPIIFSSSIQAELDNDYGKSKRMAEDYLFQSGLPVYVYRLSNAFGKWGRPNYNSACATFCYNIAHDLPIYVRDRDYVVSYNYIDDIVDAFLKCLEDGEGKREILHVEPIYQCSLGRLSDTLYYFKKEVESERHLPIIRDDFELKLFKTFCAYLSDEGMKFNFAKDHRGSFEELYKSKKWGQISENIAFPGIEKGGHYHQRKKEIFYTVIGECLIRQVSLEGDDVKEIKVSGNEPTMVDIIPNYVHSIKNIGQGDSHTLMWVDEIYDESSPDTYRREG